MVYTSHFCLWALLFLTAFESGCSLDSLKMVTSRIPKLNARIEKIEQCADFPNTTMQFKNMVVNQIGFNKFSVWGSVIINKWFGSPLRMESEMYKCLIKGGSSNCEYYFTYKKDKVCDLMEEGDKSWEYFTNYTDLPKHCPFPPNTYFVNGSIIDLQSVDYLPIFESYWRIRTKGFQDDDIVYCADSELSLKKTRNQS